MEREIPRELDEVVVAGDKVSLAVDLDQHADLVAGVDVALHHALGRLRAGALGRLGLPPGAQDLDRTLDVAVGFAERFAAGEHPRAGAVAEGLDFLSGDRAH